VRHALALDERRAWFKPTTWGQLDNDRDNATTRLDPRDLPAYEEQDINEVLFIGCHSDIGGGDLALRWILGEAANVTPPSARWSRFRGGRSTIVASTREGPPPRQPRGT
jgi:hypothetical protein